MIKSPGNVRAIDNGRRTALDAIPLECVTSRLVDMPEKRLMLAVLLDAIIQLRRPGSTGAVEAVEWIRGEAPDAPFSFPVVCEALGLDAAYLTRGVFAWARNAPAAAPLRGARLRRPQVRALKLSARRRSERAVAAM
jgi:hypothetical protein